MERTIGMVGEKFFIKSQVKWKTGNEVKKFDMQEHWDEHGMLKVRKKKQTVKM